jgi:regulator of replication initiation timing
VGQVEQLLDENTSLRRDVEQNRSLMKSQAEAIQTLQESNWKKWGLGVAETLEVQDPESLDDAALQEAISSRISGSAPSGMEDDSEELEHEAQFTQLTAVSEKLNSIEKELEDLKLQFG